MVTNLIRFVYLAKDKALMVNRIIAILPRSSSYSDRIISDSKANNKYINLTGGKRVKSIILLEDGFIAGCSVNTPTLIQRIIRTIASPLSSVNTLPPDFKNPFGVNRITDANEISDDPNTIILHERVDTVSKLSEEYEDDEEEDDDADKYEEDENDEDEDDVNTFDDDEDEAPMALPSKASPVDYDDDEAPKYKRKRGRPRKKPVEDSDDI